MEWTKPDDPVFVTKAAEIVMAHLDQHDFSGNELAANLNLSREQTHRKLKKDTDLPTGKFISYLRLLKAYHYLLTARYSIAEIAYKVGFESPAYFNKCFREAFGIRPGEVKKNGETVQSQGMPIFKFYQLPAIFTVLNSAGVAFSFQKQKEEKPPLRRPIKQWSTIAFFVVIAIVTMAYYYKSSKEFSGFSPGENGRIAIVPFNNQTGDSLMAPVGDIASSWISGQLDDLTEIKVVPYLTIKEYLPYLGILPDDPKGRPTLGEVAHADYIITGSYFVRSGNLYVDSRLVDARSQEVIYSIPVITGPKDSVMQVLETLRLKIAGLLTNLEDVKMGKLNPPGYEAYVHYLEGLAELKSGQYPRQARLHFENAAVQEPDFVMPQLFLTWFYRGHQLDSLVRVLGKIKNTTKYEKSVCAEATELFLNRNYMESLRISLKMLENYPQDYYFNLIAGHRAKAQFMPALCLEVLSKLQDPLQKDVGLVWYYYKIWNVTGSLMLLRKYEEAIAYLNSIPPDYHNHAIPTIYIAAYVPLGKTQSEIEELITRFCRNDEWCAQYYTAAAYEFSLISATETARYFANKAKTLMSALPEKKSFDFDLIDVHYLAGDYKGAKALVKQELQKNPADLELKTYLAYIEASLGNNIVAEEIFSEIKENALIYWRRNEFSYQLDYLKARLYALTGKKEAALESLKRSLVKGQFCHHWDFDRDIFLKNIFSEPSFQSIIKPKEYNGITGLP